MEKSITSCTFFFSFFILSQLVIHIEAVQHNVVNNIDKPSFIRMITDKFFELKETHRSSLDKIKSIIRETQTQFFPPNLDFRSADEANARGGVDTGGAKGKVKEAVERSFGASEDAVKESAELAGKLVGEAMHQAAEKMKHIASDKKDSDSEF